MIFTLKECGALFLNPKSAWGSLEASVWDFKLVPDGQRARVASR